MCKKNRILELFGKLNPLWAKEKQLWAKEEPWNNHDISNIIKESSLEVKNALKGNEQLTKNLLQSKNVGIFQVSSIDQSDGIGCQYLNCKPKTNKYKNDEQVFFNFFKNKYLESKKNKNNVELGCLKKNDNFIFYLYFNKKEEMYKNNSYSAYLISIGKSEKLVDKMFKIHENKSYDDFINLIKNIYPNEAFPDDFDLWEYTTT